MTNERDKLPEELGNSGDGPASSPSSPPSPTVPSASIDDDEKHLSVCNSLRTEPDGVESFVCAVLVRVTGARLEVALPLVGPDNGSLEGEAISISERLSADLLELLPRVRRLPVKSLASDDVAIVTRRSLLRLVTAARQCADPQTADLTGALDDLEQALEPFAMFREE